MKKHILAAALAATALGAAAQRIDTYETSVGPFDKLDVKDNINIVYACNPDSTGFVRYEASDLVSESLVIETTKRGTLKIRYAKYSPAKELTDYPTVYVYSDFLTSATFESDAKMTILHPSPVPVFKATLIGNGALIADGVTATNVSATVSTGNGTLTISGRCTRENVSMIGAGNIQADMLQASQVKCTLGGTGSVGVWATDRLTVNNAGSTKVFYKGDPQLKLHGNKEITRLPE